MSHLLEIVEPEVEMANTRKRPSDEQVALAIAANFSFAGTLRSLGLIPAGGNYATIKAIVANLDLDISHFKGHGWNKGITLDSQPRRKLEEILQQETRYPSTKLKRRLVKAKLKTEICEICGLEEWNGKPIPLELDHANGIRPDNRLENLRLLCPNCHAQTPTYRGKNIAYQRRAGDGKCNVANGA